MNFAVNKAAVASKAKSLALQILIGVAIGFPVRASVVTSFCIAGDSVSPELHSGS